MKFAGIPAELKELRQWVLWKTVVIDGEPRKIPYQTNGMPASSNKSETWASFESVVELVENYDGIGFVFCEGDPYCGIDFDSCRNPEIGLIEEWAKEQILKLASYAEVSPTQTGAKVIVRAKWNGTWHQHKISDATPTGDKAPGIEVYDSLRYFTLTGIVLKGQSQIADRQQEVDELQAWVESQVLKTSPPVLKSDFRSSDSVFQRARKYVSRIPGAVSKQGGHNATFHVACVLVLGFGLSRDEALSAIIEWNSTCQPPWSEKELIHKVDSAMQQGGERNYLRNVDPKNFDKINTPKYEMPQHEASVVTLREAVEKYIESVKSGNDGLIELGIPELDYGIGGGAAPGELMLLAARPSHGKSAVSLQMTHHWTREGIPSAFISEEMSAMAIGKRTIQFATEIPQEHWSVRMAALESDIDKHFFDRAFCAVVEQCRTAEGAAEALRRMKEKHDIRCAIVDYAQLLQSPGKSRYEQVTNTSICLRQVANETGILLVALAQLNREIEGRSEFVPVLGDLRDSGQLEQDADVVICSVWPHRINSKNDPHVYQFFVMKNRNRATNGDMPIECRFEPSRQRFVDKKQGRSYANTNDPDDF